MLAMLSRLRRRVIVSLCTGTVLTFASFGAVASADDKPAMDKNAEKKDAASPVAADGSAGPSGGQGGAPSQSTPRPKHPPYADVLREFKAIDGLIKLHRK